MRSHVFNPTYWMVFVHPKTTSAMSVLLCGFPEGSYAKDDASCVRMEVRVGVMLTDEDCALTVLRHVFVLGNTIV